MEPNTKPLKETVSIVWLSYLPLVGLSQNGIEKALEYFISPNGTNISDGEAQSMAMKILDEDLLEDYEVEELANIIKIHNREQIKLAQPERYEFTDLNELGHRLEKQIKEKEELFERNHKSKNISHVDVLEEGPKSDFRSEHEHNAGTGTSTASYVELISRSYCRPVA